MKQGKTIQELAAEIARQADAKRDFIADTRHMKFHTTPATENNAVASSSLGINGQGVFAVNPHAHNQIAERLGIPAKYYDRMRTEAPALLDANVNGWLQSKPERRLVRTLDQHARAFLSDRYRRLDNIDLLGAILPDLAGDGRIQIASTEVTESKLYLKFVVPSLELEVKKGDVVRAGGIVSNSEIGMGALSVQPFVERLICINGAVVSDMGQRRYHTGRAASDDQEAYELFSDETLKADDTALWMKVRDTIKGVLSEAKFKLIVDRFRSAADQQIQGDPVKAVEVLSNQLNMREEERGNVLRHLIQGGDLSKWGLMNAVTRASQDVESYDRATELETAGGTVLNLAPDQWRTISEAK
jgi:hypothetical protein